MKRAKQALVVLALGVVTPSAWADDPRFSRTLEYALMDSCVSRFRSNQEKNEVIKRCACALEKTQEDGFWPDYDRNSDYWENREQFAKDFAKNIKYFSDKEVKCTTK